MTEPEPLETQVARLQAEVERLKRENTTLAAAKRSLHNELLKVYPLPKFSEEDLVEGMKTAVPWKTAVMDQLENWVREAQDRQSGS